MITFKLKVDDAHAREVHTDQDGWLETMGDKIEKILAIDGVDARYLEGVHDTLKLLRMARDLDS